MDGQNIPTDSTSGQNTLHSEESVSLHGSASTVGGQAAPTVPISAQSALTPLQSAFAPAPAPVATPAVITPAAASPATAETSTAVSDSGPFTIADYQDDDLVPPTTDTTEISWTAAEFIAHDKTTVWYVVLSIVFIIIAALGYLISRDFITVAVILICGILFGYSAARKPRDLQYSLSGTGIHVGAKFYPYQNFRSFSVIDEGNFCSIDFMPLKRFSPMLTVYYDIEHEDRIAGLLTKHLPLAQHNRSLTDELMHRIHF